MLDQLSEAARRAVDFARARAGGRADPMVQPADLLAALIADELGPVTAILRESGIRRDCLPDELSFTAPDGAKGSVPELPLSPESRSLVARAIEQSLVFSRFELAQTEDLFMAILEHWPPAQAAFREQGIDPRSLLERYQSARRPVTVKVDVDLRLQDAGEQGALDRMIDANANRLREALRVLEDYARFAKDDAHLSASLKTCRHELQAALEEVSPIHLLAARDTLMDVGMSLRTATEEHRHRLADVVAANCKRAQESARSLEECLKIKSVRAARTVERIRYSLYTIEKRLRAESLGRAALSAARLYWLIEPARVVRTIDWMLEQASAGGVQIVQLRDKASSDREILARARQLRQWTRELGILFIVNDRPDIALRVDADGVHLGQDDLPLAEVRRLVGADRLIGLSTHSIVQAQQAVEQGADYIGVGPVFPSTTKHFDEHVGLELVRQVASAIRIPAFCIGGIDTGNVSEVIAAGGRRVAVAGVVNTSTEPFGVARTLRSLLDAPWADNETRADHPT